MDYNFDQVIERRGSDSFKYDTEKMIWGREDLLPLWVADMDFKTPDFIINAIKERLDHEILGYTTPHAEYYKVFADWSERRYGMHIEEAQIHYLPGIVPGIYMIVNSFTSPGDKIMIQPPVYHPFRQVIQATGREVVYNQLILDNGRFKMDYHSMERDIKGCKLFILCNPHNPGGRIWDKEELAQVAQICAENGTIVISDEIHADMAFPPHKHNPFAISSEQARSISITLMAPTKAFNMPGIVSSQVIVFDPLLRTKFFSYLNGNHIAGGNVFAFIATRAAYLHGEKWLERMLDYVWRNIIYMDDFVRNNTPKIKIMLPEASFLIFMDCRQLGFESQKELETFFVDEARLGLNTGTMFGPGGEGWMRLNAASPRSIIEEAMARLKKGYDKIVVP